MAAAAAARSSVQASAEADQCPRPTGSLSTTASARVRRVCSCVILLPLNDVRDKFVFFSPTKPSGARHVRFYFCEIRLEKKKNRFFFFVTPFEGIRLITMFSSGEKRIFPRV